MGEGSSSVTNHDFQQVAQMLHELGFIVQSADLQTDTIVIRPIQVRR